MTMMNKLLTGGNNMIRTLEKRQKEVIRLANKGKDYDFLADEIDKLRKERSEFTCGRCIIKWRE